MADMERTNLTKHTFGKGTSGNDNSENEKQKKDKFGKGRI